jgi:hypothetical protein
VKTLYFSGSLVGLAIASVLAAEAPTRTPTPAPRLSGGFGRPRATAAPTPAEPGGQSLADVVQAAHGPKEVAPPDKGSLTISNRSLVKSADQGRVSTSKLVAPARPAATSPASALTAVPTAAAKPVAEAGESGAPAPTEAEWKGIAAKARKRVADDKAHVAELEAATKKLENDFYAWDDGQYRDRVIKPAWDRSREDLENAKQELAAAEANLADLPEKARKAGALPGWIRE